MNRKVLSLMFAVVMILSVFSACNLFKSPVLYVAAVLTTSSGSGLAMVTVKKDSSSGTPVDDATVKMNGNALAHVSSGTYGATVSGVTDGLSITVSVSGAGDNVSVSANAPVAPGTSTTNISGAVSGSNFTMTCN